MCDLGEAWFGNTQKTVIKNAEVKKNIDHFILANRLITFFLFE